jgi:hypothetical protein
MTSVFKKNAIFSTDNSDHSIDPCREGSMYVGRYIWCVLKLASISLALKMWTKPLNSRHLHYLTAHQRHEEIYQYTYVAD